MHMYKQTYIKAGKKNEMVALALGKCKSARLQCTLANKSQTSFNVDKKIKLLKSK